MELIGRTPITLIRAPAGFGKSTAMRAHRAMEHVHRSAWVSFGASPTVERMAGLLADAVGALARRPAPQPGPRPDVVGHVPGPTVLDVLADELLGLDGPWWLYLDSVHRLSAATTVDLGGLVERFAAADGRSNGAMVIATRTTPPWPLEEWRLAGRLTVIGPDELRLDADETRAVLGDPDADRADQVLAATSGWPGAVVAAGALFDARSGGRSAEAEAIAEALESFIRDEVLADLDPSDLLLLVGLAEAGRASAVPPTTRPDDAVVRLRRLAAETGLVVELGEQRFELHPLLDRALTDHLGRPR